ncbi:hypothetical protein BJX99DRAFT_253760 [Aspergillus californicus]
MSAKLSTFNAGLKKCEMTNEEFRVAVICLLPVESKQASDTNNYILGKITRNNVILVYLSSSSPDVTPAALALQFRLSFTILFILRVGIGSGVPTAHKDIRLEDVVVSWPGKTRGGVAVFDEQDERRGGGLTYFRERPKSHLICVIQKINAQLGLGNSNVPRFMADVPTAEIAHAYPGEDKDILFNSDYVCQIDTEYSGLTRAV